MIWTKGSIISYIFVFISYVFFGMYNIIYSSLFEAITPIKLMGRVEATINTIIAIAMPLGALFGGWVLKILPYSYAMIFSAIASVITSIFYYKLKKVNTLPYIDNIERNEIRYI